MASLEASGEAGLCEGGVGNDAEGEEIEIRASRGSEFGPSAMYCARMKQAVAMIRGGYNMHSGVRYLKDNHNTR